MQQRPMKYELLKKLRGEKFRRLTGVKIATFAKMVGILKEAELKQKEAGLTPYLLKTGSS